MCCNNSNNNNNNNKKGAVILTVGYARLFVIKVLKYIDKKQRLQNFNTKLLLELLLRNHQIIKYCNKYRSQRL